MDTRTSPFRLRIEQVQAALKRRGLQALLVPSSDPHLSEYLPERWQGRQWLSGFTGSMGTLVVAQDRAAVFADSRYWTQACNDMIERVCQLFPDKFLPSCQLPQPPSASTGTRTASATHLTRAKSYPCNQPSRSIAVIRISPAPRRAGDRR